ncbi:MAG: hypothetical protein K2L51_03590, partial [Clostridiales bacterium]|nr:hypothetical protein [Clostridiales bacterium]
MPETVEAIAGFIALYNGTFSFGTQFNGGNAFVRKNNENCILQRNGELLSIAEDLTDITLCGDKYIFGEGAYVGVRNVSGVTILSAQFDRVEIAEDVILAIRGNRAETYTESGKRIGEHIFT